jgi:hypothetical protein
MPRSSGSDQTHQQSATRYGGVSDEKPLAVEPFESKNAHDAFAKDLARLLPRNLCAAHGEKFNFHDVRPLSFRHCVKSMSVEHANRLRRSK